MARLLVGLGEVAAPAAGYTKAVGAGLSHDQFSAGRAVLGVIGLIALGFFAFRAWRAHRRTP